MENMVQTAQSKLGAGLVSTPAQVRRTPVRSSRATLVSPLVRHLSSVPVRILDLISLSVALFVTLFSSLLEHGETVSGFLALRVSIRSVLIEAFLLVIWNTVFWATGLYQSRLNRGALTYLWRVPLSVLICAVTLTPLASLLHQTLPEAMRAGFVFWFTGTTLLFATRAAYYTLDEHVRPLLRKHRNLLVVGTGPQARMMAAQFADHPEFNYQLIGFVDTDPQPECANLAPVLGNLDDLELILMHQPIDEVLVALPIKSRYADIQSVASICGRVGVQMQYPLDLFTTDEAKNMVIDENTNSRVVEMVYNDQRLMLKDIFDRIASFFGLLLLSPLLLLIAAAIKFTSKGPVFFVQERWGKNRRTFGMYKFRSMVVDAEARQAALEKNNELGGPMFKMRNDPRITKVGAFLRRTSLDELPQLFNVLKGDMSLVGPRPLPNRDVALFSEPWLMRRFSVKPGITGLWQVSGRSNTDFDQTIRLDLEYIDQWSLLLDLKILLRTFSAVFEGRGAF